MEDENYEKMALNPGPAIKIPFRYAILPIIIMIAFMAVAISVYEIAPHVPLIVGAIIAAIVASLHGYTWKTIEEGIYIGIKMALPAVVIIMMIGLVIGSWIGGGIIATMIYYGLEIISPPLFLLTICIICATVTLAVGSSWSTLGTIGVAGIGIGISIGIPSAMTAGAIISGAYFGDKMSPLSDTTNLAAGITDTDLFEHIRYMTITTLPAMTLALVVYFFLGQSFDSSNIDTGRISEILAVIDSNFVISPWLLLVPVAVVVLVAKRVPALPALTVGIILGWLCHVFIQGGDIGVALGTLNDGYAIESGNEMIDTLFNRGGIDAMMFTVSLTIVAMSFGGIMEQTGMLHSIVTQILRLAKTAKSLIVATLASAFLTNATASEQYISILLPGRMYVEAFKEKGLHSKNLSRALEDGGTVTSVLIPWNTCGVFAFSMLGVSAFEYVPYAVFNYATPLIAIILAMMNFKIQYLSPAEKQALLDKKQALYNAPQT